MNKHKILLVDDEKNILRSLTRLLTETNHEVFAESNPEEALKLIEKKKFSLIISDQKMPEMTGTEMLKKAKEIQPDAIRIVLSGYAEVEIIISAINEGEIYKFITKPWSDENMLIEVKKALEYYDLKMEREELMQRIKQQNKELKKFNEMLEKKVREKTKELQLAYSEKALLAERLQEKVDELNGRDILLQHLLEYHDLSETLNVTLKVIDDVLKPDKCIMYLKGIRDNFLEAKAAMGITEKHIKAEPEELTKIDKIDLNEEEHNIIIAYRTGKTINDDGHVFVPVKRENKILGVLEVSQSDEIDNKYFEKLHGFISLVAIAINDSIVNENLPELQNKIEEILGEI